MFDINNFRESGKNVNLNLKLTGTTTVGIVCPDGVILGSDRRATSGFFISHPHVKKIFRIDDHLAATIAGLVADAQQIIEFASSNIKLYKYQHNRPMSVKAASNMLSNLLARSKYYPYFVQLLIGGVDSTGPHLFALDPYGTLTEEHYTATGSGSPTALGVLEDAFKQRLSVNEAVSIVARAIESAIKRDPASGGGFNIVVITEKEYREIQGEDMI